MDPASMQGYIQTVPFAIYQEILFNANKVLKQYLVLTFLFFLFSPWFLIQFCSAFELHGHPLSNSDVSEPLHGLDNGSSASEGPLSVSTSSHNSNSISIVQLELSLALRLLVVVFCDGLVALCSISKKGLKQTDSINAERWLTTGDAVCASVASDQRILAVGCKRGVVELYDLAESASLLRSVSLYDWG